MKVQIYITDQNHEAQLHSLPENAIPGFVVQVYNVDKNGKPLRCQASMWNKTYKQAEEIAEAYYREYGIKHALGWT